LGRDYTPQIVMEIFHQKARKKLPGRDIPPLQTQVKIYQLIHIWNPHLLQLLQAKSHKQTLPSALMKPRAYLSTFCTCEIPSLWRKRW
jgi:hypothetical protein